MYGQILRRLRESKGRTQAEVAKSVGISAAHLARLESSQRGLYVEDFVAIAQALGEEPGNLLPNELGDIAHLKPLIDRLSSVSPQVLPRIAAILGSLLQLTEEVASPVAHEPVPKKKKVSGKTRQAAPRKGRLRGSRE